MLYFDCNATVSLHPAARQAWIDTAQHNWHNPSGLYAAATRAREILEDCRERLGSLIDCAPHRIIFTAGATASANMLANFIAKTIPPEVFSCLSAIEHPCVVDSFHTSMPHQVIDIPVDCTGTVSTEVLSKHLHSQAVALVSIMAASNESGVIQPWAEISEMCRHHQIPFHTDAAQWFGKMPSRGLGVCDWISGSGHKFGGPRGIGFLVIPENLCDFHGDRGGPQENGHHAGTENVAGIAAMLAALEAREQEIQQQNKNWLHTRRKAEQHFEKQIPQAVILGKDTHRLWNTIAAVIPKTQGKKIIARLDRAGIAASTGSACSAGSDSIPRIASAIGVEALGVKKQDLLGTVRLSSHWETTLADWVAAIDALSEVVNGTKRDLPSISLSDLH
ncbi:MAG: aminotransferase class V-fold PLP-dependent enzyme [Pirellulales bacterium]